MPVRRRVPVAVLHNEALPLYAEKGLRLENVLTDNGREFCGSEGHPYRIYLELNEIKHRTTKVRGPQTNGFVERFNRTVLDEFFVFSSLEAGRDVIRQDEYSNFMIVLLSGSIAVDRRQPWGEQKSFCGIGRKGAAGCWGAAGRQDHH